MHPTASAQEKQLQTANLPLVEESVAVGEVAEAFADYRTRFERDHVPGILKCFATHPPLLKQMIALAASFLFAESSLPRVTKEMIATHVSCLNACPYCLDSHAASLKKEGGSEELVLAIFRSDLASPSISEKDRLLLLFSSKVSDESYKIGSADIEALQGIGWSHQQIAETVHITALFACFNHVANSFGLTSQHLFELRSS